MTCKQIGPFVRPVVDIGIGPQKTIDHFRSLLTRVGSVIGKKLTHFARRWAAIRSRSNVTRRKKAASSAKWTWLNFDATPFAGDQFVNLAPGFNGLVAVGITFTHDGQRGGDIVAFITGQDGCFSAAQGGQQTAPLSAVATSVFPLSMKASRVTSRCEPSVKCATSRTCCLRTDVA